MYVLLCGKPPFSGCSEIEVLKAAETGKLDFFGK